MDCQQAIADQVVDLGSSDMLSVKDNQPTLAVPITELFNKVYVGELPELKVQLQET